MSVHFLKFTNFKLRKRYFRLFHCCVDRLKSHFNLVKIFEIGRSSEEVVMIYILFDLPAGENTSNGRGRDKIKTMLVKFESKSQRVNGLSFHPKRPWILVSLHNGIIQLWEYQLCAYLEKFEEHEGPVHGICFHNQQPIFVSGGDDCKIKVWNYNQSRSWFTLLGHYGSVRSTQFHEKCPWILSASDDHTIRIWNWPKRNCITTINGHDHFVMCAQFHPTDDLVVSASLDKTVRVWDISELRRNYSESTTSISGHLHRQPECSDRLGLHADVVELHNLKGHKRGVNWAVFHPTRPLIASAADDGLIKEWRMFEGDAWEVQSRPGHYNNVTCVLFHPRKNCIVSTSEDRRIFVWGTTGRRILLETFRRDLDRFWTLVSHPSLNVFAAGHDSGMMIFKLDRERPLHAVHQNFIYYVKEKYVRRLNWETGEYSAVLMFSENESGEVVFSIAVNPEQNAVLLTKRIPKSDASSCELFSIPVDTKARYSEVQDSKKFPGHSAIWVAKKRFAVLEAYQYVMEPKQYNSQFKFIENTLLIHFCLNVLNDVSSSKSLDPD
ncbi:unnamed protein product [Orchesella dallaii]|uniref:Coatomer subunit alpha n=1 Tax=Orchesella dallaii TaxID=48710 RepID=A0ABP1R6K3_9HEXA